MVIMCKRAWYLNSAYVLFQVNVSMKLDCILRLYAWTYSRLPVNPFSLYSKITYIHAYFVDLIRVIRPLFLQYMYLCCGLMPWSGVLTAMFLNHLCMIPRCFGSYSHVYRYIYYMTNSSFWPYWFVRLMSYVCMGNFKPSFGFTVRQIHLQGAYMYSFQIYSLVLCLFPSHPACRCN